MGYGSITRALYLARKQLATAGIKNPTPQDLAAALNGGTVKTASGSMTFQGVLKLRSEGMGWGKIAHVVESHHGMHKMEHHARHGMHGMEHHAHKAHGTGTVTTAAGTTAQTASSKTKVHTGKGVVTASGAGAQAGKGIVTAGGPPSAATSTAAPKVQTGSGIVTANGATMGKGITTASAGSRHAYARSGKD